MRVVIAAISLFLVVLAGSAIAQPWQSTDPASAGWFIEKLKAAQTYATSLKPTGVMMVQDGKVIASWGDVSREVYVASVRKSLLSALYGIVVSEGRVVSPALLPISALTTSARPSRRTRSRRPCAKRLG